MAPQLHINCKAALSWCNWEQLLAEMLVVHLIFSATVLHVQASLLHQSQRFQFVDIGDTTQISCTSAEDMQHGGIFFSWYKRQEGGIFWVKNCFFNQDPSKFVCRAQGKDLILEIAKVQKEDSGIYFCAEHHYINFSFSMGTSLIVGDSYTPNTWVMVLQPQASHYEQNASDCLVCVVHGVSNSVQVSWHIPGGLQPEGRTLLVRNSSSNLTFLSMLRIPAGQWETGGLYTCQVRFNSTGPPVKKSTTFATPHLLAQVGQCPDSTVSLAVATGLSLLLVLLLIVLWIQFGPSRPGFQGFLSKVPELPTSEDLQDRLSSNQLDFPLKPQDINKKRQAPQGEKLKT